MKKYHIKTGQRFNQLVAIGFIEKRKSRDIWRWHCDCGNIRAIRAARVAAGDSKSCGCLLRAKSTMHGRSRTSEYNIWATMIARCENPNHIQFSDYGGRGIKICKEWRASFAAFYSDMGARPSASHSLERGDNEGDYEPSNVRWATRAEQMRNTRHNVWITFNGTTQCATDWAKQIGVSHSGLIARLRVWGVERALTTPPFAHSHKGK